MAAQRKPKIALRLTPPEIEEIFRRFKKASPAPTTELEYTNPYTLLVAVVLSAQATDAGVNKATRPVFAKIDSPQKMLKFGEEKLRQAIGSIGLYRMKAKNVIALSKKLIDEFGGEVPQTHENLESLLGVGRKTANVILNTIYKQPTMAVDTHVFRVANRTGLAKGGNPREVEDELLRVIPEKYLINAHHWLILHGRYVCTARRPDCPHCMIARYLPLSGQDGGTCMSKAEFDVLGIGNAIVDMIAPADDDFLLKYRIPKGGMHLIDEARAEELYNAMGPVTEVSGGCAGNTAAALASMGGISAFVGKVKDDL